MNSRNARRYHLKLGDGGRSSDTCSLIIDLKQIIYHTVEVRYAVPRVDRASREGIYDDVLRQAVAALQKHHRLPPTGEIDAKTWAVLHKHNPYRVQHLARYYSGLNEWLYDASHKQQQQPPSPTTKTIGDPQNAATDRGLEKLFTDGGLVVAADSYRNLIGGDTHFRLSDGKLHTIHIYGDKTGVKITGVYMPKEFSVIKYEGGGTVTATDPKTGEVIGAAHVRVASQQQLNATLKKANVAKSRYIGDIAGTGGNTPIDKHSHLTIFKNGASRLKAKSYKDAGKKEGRDYDSKIAEHLGDFRRLVQGL